MFGQGGGLLLAVLDPRVVLLVEGLSGQRAELDEDHGWRTLDAHHAV
ncbi:MAG TPA: hypothetical protein VK784_13150 [Pseudonocardiaceae bacterium]|nr:hypothetical protein [Pseudonocardiaceae bacterium]